MPKIVQIRVRSSQIKSGEGIPTSNDRQRGFGLERPLLEKPLKLQKPQHHGLEPGVVSDRPHLKADNTTAQAV